MGRRSRQRQGVVLYKGRKNGGLDLCQSRRKVNMGVSIYLLHDGFFSFAVVRQQLVFDFFLMGKDNQSNQKHHDKAKYNADTSADGGRYRGFIVS